MFEVIDKIQDDLTLKALHDCRGEIQDMMLAPGQIIYIDNPSDISHPIFSDGDDTEEYW
jgi:hypothetical protein